MVVACARAVGVLARGHIKGQIRRRHAVAHLHNERKGFLTLEDARWRVVLDMEPELVKEEHMSEEQTSEQAHGLTLPVAPPARRGSTRVSSKRLLTREEAVSEDYDLTPGPDDASGSASSGDAQDTPLLKAPEEKYCGPLRLVLLGQNGVGKSSLALSLAGLSDESLSVDSETLSDEAYQRRVTVDDEDSTILVYDNWKQDISMLQCEVCILVFSLTDRHSFYRVSRLRLSLRESHSHTPIILVGNKSDLVRTREISTEEAHSNAMMFDCVYLELSVALDHGTNELLETAVRVARGQSLEPGWTGSHRESLTSRAKRFLSGLVPRLHHGREQHRGSQLVRQKSRSCHDLSALM